MASSYKYQRRYVGRVLTGFSIHDSNKYLPYFQDICIDSKSIAAQFHQLLTRKLNSIMASTSALKIQDDKLSSLGLNKMVVNKEQVTTYSRALGAASEKNPILVLVHGYPESAFM